MQQNLEKIGKLSPAAARLLLAYQYSNFGDKLEDYIKRAGITDMETYRKAKKQLTEFGFLVFTESVMPARCEQKPERTTSPYTATVQTKK
jgi:hypothetical protein